MFPVAVDYLRFSKLWQEAGDSIRRQVSLADAWEARTKIPIDRTIELRDEGVTAFQKRSWDELKKQDPDRYALARFLKLCEEGRLQRGDYLLIENLDRLSRESEVSATHLLTSILMLGIKVVQLSPYELELDDKSDAFQIMRAILELSRGHSESKNKRNRTSAAREINRQLAAAQKRAWRTQVPNWIRRVPTGDLDEWGKPVLRLEMIPECKAVIRRMAELAMMGLGCGRIARKLNAEGVPAFGERVPLLNESGVQRVDQRGRPRWKAAPGCRMGCGRWRRLMVYRILSSRRTMGELETFFKDGTPTGVTVPIPAALTEEEWLAIQPTLTERKKFKGRASKSTVENLWSGLIEDAVSGSSCFVTSRSEGRKIVNQAGLEGEAAFVSFPADSFDQAVAALLAEVNPAEILGSDGPDKVSEIGGRLEIVRKKLAALQAQLDDLDEVPRGIVRKIADLEAEESSLEEQRRVAQREAATPLSEAWGQALTLLDCIETASDRLRLRTLLRRIIKNIRILVVPRGRDRLAAVQLFFAEGGRRDFLILHRPRRAEGRKEKRIVPGCVKCRSCREANGLDLREPAHVVALQRALSTLDLSSLLSEAKP
jgi:DNA invertase Pin-like site-specific DNA recombinase